MKDLLFALFPDVLLHFFFFLALGHMLVENYGSSLSNVTFCCRTGRNLSCPGISLAQPGVPSYCAVTEQIEPAAKAQPHVPGRGAVAGSCGMSAASSPCEPQLSWAHRLSSSQPLQRGFEGPRVRELVWLTI